MINPIPVSNPSKPSEQTLRCVREAFVYTIFFGLFPFNKF